MRFDKTMKSKIILGLALVLSGVILNVLVAWGCVLWSPYSHYVWPQEKADHTLPGTILGPNHSPGWWHTSTGFGVFESEPWNARVDDETYFHGFRSSLTPAFFCCGWPMFSMQSLVTHYEDVQGHYLAGRELPCAEIIHRGLQTSKLPARLHAQENRRLPAVPLWFGFIGNTLFYSLVLFGFHRFSLIQSVLIGVIRV